MARETEYQKLEQSIYDLISRVETVEAENAKMRTVLIACAEALNASEWSYLWQLMNDFVSGKTQQQFARVEPMAVLAEVYQGCAMIYSREQAALKVLSESGLLPKEETSEDQDRTEIA